MQYITTIWILIACFVHQVPAKIASTTQLALQFLENEVERMSDVYELAISSYALTLAGSAAAPTVKAKLMDRATLEGMKH